ncbi:hypothetical protein JCM17039_01150 [Blautia glucerasea]
MAAAKNQTAKKGTTKTTRKNTARKKSTSKKQGAASGFQTEIILLIILAASMILVLSNLGFGGTVGEQISTVCFGIMGLPAYIFPVFLFVGAAFFMSNRRNRLAYKKLLAALVFFIFVCGFVQLLTEGYIQSTTISDYYHLCAEYHTGGGVIGGAICMSTTQAFGVAGGYIIIIAVMLISLIIITQKSFFDFVFKIWDGILGLVKGGHELYMEGQPERNLKKEIREQERRQKKELRQAERIRRLEETLEAEKKAAQALEAENEMAVSRQSVQTQSSEESHGFLEGTKLEPSRPPAAEFDLNPVSASSDNNVETGAEETGKDQLEFQIHRSDPVAEEAAVPDLFEDFSPADSLDFDSADSVSQETTAAPEPSQPHKNPKSSKKEIENGIQNIQQEISTKTAAEKKEYHYPPLKLLKRGSGKSQGDSDAHLRKTAQKLQETLHNFGVNVTVTNVSCGPTVTRYELQPEMGVKVSRIVGLADDIKLNLATADIRIEAPIPGKAAVGIEVPNKENHAVMLREILQSQEFQGAKSTLSFAVGKDIAGKPVVTDIAKMPHLLIAGATGSGKSVCINTLIVSILYKSSPDDVKLIMIDPKVVELSVYNGIPHLFIPVVTDPKKAAGALNWAVTEMMNRYNTFAEFNVRNLEEYNRKVENMKIPEGETPPEKMPQIVIIVDELADLMMVAPGEVEDAICRLAQLARAAGIHLIIATQRPSVNVITGLIKANMPSRIAFSVSSGVDSRTILDMNGAEKLLGKGDMLFYPQGYQKPVRLQGAFVSDEEVSSIVEFLSSKNPTVEYDTQIEQQVNTVSIAGAGSGNEEKDVYFEEAGKFIIDKEKASIGMLQRMFKIGFNRAARIMDQLCDAGVVGPEEGTKPRKVLMSMEEFQNYIEESL